MSTDASQTAFIGTLIGAGVSLASSVVTPWLLRRSERRRAARSDRAAALRRLLPEIFNAGAQNPNAGLSNKEMGRRLALTTELRLWLSDDEWEISSIALASLLNTDKDIHITVQATASLVLTAWARGEISSARALQVFEHRTGARITKPTFDDVS